MLGIDLDLAGHNPKQRVAVDDEPSHAGDATRVIAVRSPAQVESGEPDSPAPINSGARGGSRLASGTRTTRKRGRAAPSGSDEDFFVDVVGGLPVLADDVAEATHRDRLARKLFLESPR